MFVDEAFPFAPDVYNAPGDAFADLTLTGPYAFSRFAGVRFRGINLVPRPTDTGNGDTTPISPANFYDLFYDLATLGTTNAVWTQWIKPQIDAAASLGANCVRIICQPTVRVGDSTHHGTETFRGVVTNAQLASAYDAIITYLAAKGMYFYPALMEAASVDVLTTAQILQFCDEAAAIVSNPAYHNIIGIDVSQEMDRSTWSTTAGNLRQAHAHVRAALRQPLPITSSIGIAQTWATSVPTVALAGVDFLDFHSYLYTDALWLTLQSPNVYGLPIMTGETGIAFNGYFFDHPGVSAQETVHPYSSELRRRHYQDVVAGFGQRWDQQATCVWGVTKEWPSDNLDIGLFSDAQDASFNFTTERTEETGPFRTIPTAPQAYNVAHVLDLTGADTLATANTTYGLGWSQHDYAGVFSRSTNRAKRASAAGLAVGVVDLFGLPSTDQSVSVDFDASQATLSGGQADWTVSVRHRGDTVPTLAHTTYYFADVAAKPGDLAVDGAVSIYKVVAGVPSLLDGTFVTQPFDLTHAYRLSLTATGAHPTTLALVLTDLTTSTVIKTRTITDTTARLQGVGSPGLPSLIGTVYYTNIQYVTTNELGPSLVAPVIGTATANTLPVSWTAVGGVAPYRYIPQYVPLDSNGFPSGSWVSRPTTTGTSDTIPDLSPGTRYAVRVQVVDARAA